jgi:hypothetical protein
MYPRFVEHRVREALTDTRVVEVAAERQPNKPVQQSDIIISDVIQRLLASVPRVQEGHAGCLEVGKVAGHDRHAMH